MTFSSARRNSMSPPQQPRSLAKTTAELTKSGFLRESLWLRLARLGWSVERIGGLVVQDLVWKVSPIQPHPEFSEIDKIFDNKCKPFGGLKLRPLIVSYFGNLDERLAQGEQSVAFPNNKGHRFNSRTICQLFRHACQEARRIPPSLNQLVQHAKRCQARAIQSDQSHEELLYNPDIRRVCRRILSGIGDLDDGMQESLSCLMSAEARFGATFPAHTREAIIFHAVRRYKEHSVLTRSRQVPESDLVADSSRHFINSFTGQEASVSNDEYLRDTLKDLIRDMPSAHRYVLIYRYGLNGGGRLSSSQVAKRMGRSLEDTRDIEQQALKMLRSAGYSQLRHYRSVGREAPSIPKWIREAEAREHLSKVADYIDGRILAGELSKKTRAPIADILACRDNLASLSCSNAEKRLRELISACANDRTVEMLVGKAIEHLKDAKK